MLVETFPSQCLLCPFQNLGRKGSGWGCGHLLHRVRFFTLAWQMMRQGCFQASVELSCNKRLFSFSFFLSLSLFFLKSKLFFVSVLLLLSLSLFTLPVQTTNLRRNLKKIKKLKKTHHPGRSQNPFPLVNRLILSVCDHRRRPVSICAHALPATGRNRSHVGREPAFSKTPSWALLAGVCVKSGLVFC